MKRLIDLSPSEAKLHFLKGSSYFNGDLPRYISFEPILADVAVILGEGTYAAFKASNPNDCSGVNYSFISNKDGRLAWRPYELIHPAVYVSLVNTICGAQNWSHIRERFLAFEGGIVECCSTPVVSTDHQTDAATQVRSWWQRVEQRSITYSLRYSHLLHTDVTDCYGSLYTHSIAWALHGMEEVKKDKNNNSFVGTHIDRHIQAGRYGQTNGIPQGSALMDFIAEIVLGYVDGLIHAEIGDDKGLRILRYRDDYRIFANSDSSAESALKTVADKLRGVGMKLGSAKTSSARNVVEGSIKADKLAAIGHQDLGTANAKTIQKQLLRLHTFGQRFPNSGALRRLVSEFHVQVANVKEAPEDLDVQVAIATDIAFTSPATFPAVAGILSRLVALAPEAQKIDLWTQVREKMGLVPYNGYLEIWLQRVTAPKSIGLKFESNEKLCQIVNGEKPELWNSGWISSPKLKSAMDVSKLVVAQAEEAAEVVQPEEVELFRQSAWEY